MRAGFPARALLVLLLLGAPLPAAADVVSLVARIDGQQANAGAGTGSTATGFADMTIDTTTNLFSWNIQWSGLQGTISPSHFHGPAPPGTNAGVTVNFGNISGLTSPSIGSTTVTSTQTQQILDELWYVNIHSSAFPAGEIRGQVVRKNEVPTLPLPALVVFAVTLLLTASLFLSQRRAASA